MVAVIIAISQGKGGVSKTTVAVNLAGALNQLQIKTRLFDWDLKKPDAYKWANKSECIDWITLIDLENAVQDIENAKQKYDVLVFDTPPQYETKVFNAVLMADFVIVPTSTDALEQENAKEAITVPMAAGKPFKILMSKVKMGTKDAKQVYKNIGNNVNIFFKEIITERYIVSKSPAAGQWIGEFSKGSDSHKQFMSLAKEVMEWTNLKCHEHSIKTGVING